ncbi:MAG: membrane protein insertase YidC [Mailhella sp.]|nr:membrane protein insertase YidC [Mailhella sp.]
MENNNKRLLLATVLCFAIILGWQYFAEYMGWIEPAPIEEVTEEKPAQQTATEAEVSAEPLAPAALFAPAAGETITVDTPLYTAKVHSGGGVLQSFELKNYKATVEPDSPQFNMISPEAAAVCPMGLMINGRPTWTDGTWQASSGDLAIQNGTAELVLTGRLPNGTLTRRLTFHADSYLIDETVAFAANEGAPVPVRLSYTLGATLYNNENSTYDPMSAAWLQKNSLKTDTGVKDLTNEGRAESGPIAWGGLMTNYFMSAVAPFDDSDSVYKARIQNDVWRIALEKPAVEIAGGASLEQRAAWWIGPKDRALLSAAPKNLEKSIDMGMFSFLALPMVWLLNFFQSFTHNYGLAIIVLTFVIKILLWPLTRKTYTSMEQMKKIQPLMKQLQEKYADNKEAMSREMMQLYKTYGVNPASGCLPMFAQLPIFYALYQALLKAIELRHASFITYLPFTDVFWLADLSIKDPLYITPIVMGVSMFLQQWLSPAQMDPNQRKMMMIMPVVFTFMFLAFPAGLVIYWLVNNILSIVQQWWTLRKIK